VGNIAWTAAAAAAAVVATEAQRRKIEWSPPGLRVALTLQAPLVLHLAADVGLDGAQRCGSGLGHLLRDLLRLGTAPTCCCCLALACSGRLGGGLLLLLGRLLLAVVTGGVVVTDIL
jgi:hypothetical protein